MAHMAVCQKGLSTLAISEDYRVPPDFLQSNLHEGSGNSVSRFQMCSEAYLRLVCPKQQKP